MDWYGTLQPIAESMVGVAALVITGAVPILLTWLRLHLNVQGLTLDAERTVALNTVIQNAVQNAAGRLTLQIASGNLDITDPKTYRQSLDAAVGYVVDRTPDALKALSVSKQTVSEMVLGKLGTALGQAINDPPSISNADLGRAPSGSIRPRASS